MPPPSQLAIASSSVLRLIKEEASYHKELLQQEARIKKIEDEGGDENVEYVLRQERRGVEETKAIFPSLKERLKVAVEKLEMHLEIAEKSGGQADDDEIVKAKDAINRAKQE